LASWRWLLDGIYMELLTQSECYRSCLTVLCQISASSVPALRMFPNESERYPESEANERVQTVLIGTNMFCHFALRKWKGQQEGNAPDAMSVSSCSD
jgi:hypothetical protein